MKLRAGRSVLLGLLPLTVLAACGGGVDQPGAVVRSVTVSPMTFSVSIGQKTTLTAQLDADEGVKVRAIVWTSADSKVATVDSTGTVTGVSVGSVQIVVSAAADPGIKAIATGTVTPSTTAGVPTVSIAGVTTTACGAAGCAQVPADLLNFGTGSLLPGATGQLNLSLIVDPKGQTITTVGASIRCGTDSVLVSQPAVAGSATAQVQLNTAAYNTTTGVPALHNPAAGQPCALTAFVAPAAGATQRSPVESVGLNNADGAVVITATSGTGANDVHGLPWRSGAVTVSALPVLYSGRAVAFVQFALPNAKGQVQLVPYAAGGPTTASWANNTSVTAAISVGQLTLASLDANGLPIGVHPTVLAIDAQGNALTLVQLNPTSQSDVRVDNQSPQPPLTFRIPESQGQWVNAAYTFAGPGPTAAAADAKYVSCGDAPLAPATIAAASYPQPGCVTPQGGVSANEVFTDGLNGQTVLTWYSTSAAAYTAQRLQASPTGTSIATAACDVTGWQKITRAGDITATSSINNQQYIVRAIESDKLGNSRCSDLATTTGTINITSGFFVPGSFGVDVAPPTASFVDRDVRSVSANDTCPFYQGLTQQLSVAGAPCGSGGVAVKVFTLAVSDDASGFSPTPVAVVLKRLFVAPGNVQTTACVMGTGASCTPERRSLQTIAADGAGSGASSGLDGYYTLTSTVNDVALNVAAPLTRTALVDREAPITGGIEIPSVLIGGGSVSFGTNASDNLDLATSNFTLSYPVAPTGSTSPLNLRLQGPTLGTPFSGTLSPVRTFSYGISTFIRNLSTTTASGAPQNIGGTGVLPTRIAARVYDAANNQSLVSTATIAPSNVPQSAPLAKAHTDFTAPQSNGATLLTFRVSNAPAIISNCTICTGGVSLHPTSITLTAAATGTEQAGASAFQLLNPFAQVQFYYLDSSINEWVLIGASTTPAVSDNDVATVRTFTWSLPGFDPPASLGVNTALTIVAIGVNASGDGLVSAPNTGISLTNP